MGWLRSDLGTSTIAMRRARSHITFSFMICLTVFVVMVIFLGWNVYLILTNQTTIEFHYNRWQRGRTTRNGEMFCNVYDVGRTRNLQQVRCENGAAVLSPMHLHGRVVCRGYGRSWTSQCIGIEDFVHTTQCAGHERHAHTPTF